MVDEGKSPSPGGTLSSDPRTPFAPTGPSDVVDPGVPVAIPVGVETLRQKAALETALFGSPSQDRVIRIAHYEVIGTLGAGGMGVVYVVHDLKLDRRVALKLLRYQDVGGIAKQRLQREAMAMARLSHPNVVTVHEVGTHEGQVFIAMEFVSGSHLRAWLAAKPRSWREIVTTFSQAGSGLAAAHAAGIIHRDFKPDNVLVGDDGRVRVADFGLAHGRGELLEAIPSSELSLFESGSLDEPLTEPGVLLGTPAYMAPEQHNGLRVDERSDQFSFCVALWEALYGQRPFKAETLPQLVEAVLSKRIDEPKSNPREVPPWLRAVILRGLSVNPYDRWSSVEALLAALARDPERVRQRRIRGALVVTLTLSIMALLGQRASAERGESARARYWNSTTEVLLDIERERGLRQATDDARRAQDAARLSAYRSYRSKRVAVEHEDPTVAAALLREVEGEARTGDAWISAANEVLGQPLSYAVLTGHRSGVLDLVFGPQGRTLYSAAGDGEVRRWVLAPGQQARGKDEGEVIIRQTRSVASIALSPDGQLLAAGSQDGTVMLWSARTPEVPARVIAEHGGEVTMVTFDPTGARLATAGKDAMAKITELQSGDTRVLTGHRGPVYALEFDRAGKRLLTASGDHSAAVWRVVDGVRVSVLEGHEDAVFHARWLGTKRVVTGSDDGSLRLWSVEHEQEPRELRRVDAAHPISALDVVGDTVASATTGRRVQIVHFDEDARGADDVKSSERGSASTAQVTGIDASSEVWSLALLPSRDALVFGAFDGSAQRWIEGARAPAQLFLGHSEAVPVIALDASGRWLATGSYDGEVRVWDLERPSLSLPVVGAKGLISQLVVGGERGDLFGASHDGVVRVWAREDGRELERFEIGDEAVYSLALSPDDSHFAAGTQAGTVVIGELATGELREISAHAGPVWDLDFSRDGDRLASTSLDGTTRIWSVAAGTQLLTLTEPDGFVTSLDFQARVGALVTAGSTGTVRVWDSHSGASLEVLDGHESMIWTMAYNPSNGTLATASEDGTARLWPRNAASGVPLVLRGHQQGVRAIAFGGDGLQPLVATGSMDGDARVWDATSGELLRTLSGHSEAVLQVLFLADGRVVTGSEDNSIRVWTRGEPSLVLSGHADAVTSLVRGSEGKLLFSGSADHSARIWRIDQLDTQVEPLMAELWSASSWCLSIARRMRVLGQDEVGARAAQRACEARHGG